MFIPAQRTRETPGENSTHEPEACAQSESLRQQFINAFEIPGLLENGQVLAEAPDVGNCAVAALVSTVLSDMVDRPSHEVLSGVLQQAACNNYTGLYAVARIKQSIEMWRLEAAQSGTTLPDGEAFVKLNEIARHPRRSVEQQYHVFLAYHLMGGDVENGKFPF